MYGGDSAPVCINGMFPASMRLMKPLFRGIIFLNFCTQKSDDVMNEYFQTEEEALNAA